MIPMSFLSTMSAFSQTIKVEDYICEHVNGVWEESICDLYPNRDITAIVLMMSTEDLKVYPNGSSSEGGINIITNDILYFADVEIEEMTTLQSYVLYGGYKWKVMGTGLFQPNTTHNTYNALRFLE